MSKRFFAFIGFVLRYFLAEARRRRGFTNEEFCVKIVVCGKMKNIDFITI
jgi:hypothetical protein